MVVDKSKCIGCGACASVCPVGAIELVDGVAQINKDVCVECGTCEVTCPVGAIVQE